jgi:cold shock protein
LPTGTVKWFNAAKGYGFIQPDGGGGDAFVHISAVERAGLDQLNEGQQVEYELVRGQNGKTSDYPARQDGKARSLPRSATAGAHGVPACAARPGRLGRMAGQLDVAG